MNIHTPTSELQRQHEKHLSARNRLWGGVRPAAKTAKAVKVVDKPKPNPRADVDCSYHVELYVAHKKAAATFRTACSFSASVSVEYRPYSEEFALSAGGEVRPSMRSICLEVLKDFPDITLEDLKGPRRNRMYVRPRQLAMYEIMRQRKDASYPMVGRFFGGRDHTTVLHAVKKVAAEKARNEE